MSNRYSFILKQGTASVKSGEKTVFEAKFDGSTVTIDFYYDVRDKALTLTAAAKAGDRVDIDILPYKLSVFVNGDLADEEWPFGNALYGDLTEAEGDIRITPDNMPKKDTDAEPAVTRTFVGADNIRLPGVNIGDCMPYSDGGAYHLFYLYDRHHHHSKWGLGAHQWAHVSTEDFIHFSEHPMAVAITEPWEGSICTGSVMKAKDKYYAWYAVRMSDYSPARLTCAVSSDGYHFTKSKEFFSLPGAYETTSARDPKVFEYDGEYHMFVTTTYLQNQNGCLAHLKSDDMIEWEDVGPVFMWSDGSQPECPDWFSLNSKYYLIYSIGGKAHYKYSSRPFDGWVTPENDIIPCGTVPKAAFLKERLIFCGFIGEGTGYAGSLTAAEAKQKADGSLEFYELKI